MKPRSLAALGLLLLCAVAWTQTSTRAAQPKAGAPATAPAAEQKKPVVLYDGVPDTGQFLPDTTVLGRIDGRVFRVLEFRDRWFASYMADRPRTDSAGRYEFLNSMVNKEVLATVARDVNRPLAFEDRVQLRETRQRLLANAAFARLVTDSVHYSGSEVQHIYDQGNHALHLQHIVADDPATAERAYADVMAKRLTWAQAVAKYSNKRSDKGPDGDLGWVTRIQLDPEPALEIFDLPDGAISSVFFATGDFRGTWGWQFVRVVERRPEKQPAFAAISGRIHREIQAVQIARWGEKVRELLRRRIGMAYDSTNIAWAAGLFAEAERQARPTTTNPTIDMSGAQPDFQPTDTARVLARWQGGSYTLGNFLAEYNQQQPLQRPLVGSFNAFRSELDRYALEPFTAQLAEERGFDRDPIVVEGMARLEESLRVEHLFSDSILARVWVTPEERQKYYQDHLPGYMTLPTVTFAAIVRPSRAGADSVAARLRAGEDPAAILRADSLAGFISGSIRTVHETEADVYQKPLFEEMRPGNVIVVGPDPSGNFLVLNKLAHDGGHLLRYEEVQTLVDESCQNLKAEQLLKDFLARYRTRHDIVLYPERLPRILLTDPADEQ